MDPSTVQAEGSERHERQLQWIHTAIVAVADGMGWPHDAFDAAAERTRADLGIPGAMVTAGPLIVEAPDEGDGIDADFWALVDELPGHIDAASATALAAELARRGGQAVESFANSLHAALQHLAGPDFAGRPVTDSESGIVGMAPSDDVFLYARCAIVAAGQQEWEKVRAAPREFSADRKVFDGEFLLTVAEQARSLLG